MGVGIEYPMQAESFGCAFYLYQTDLYRCVPHELLIKCTTELIYAKFLPLEVKGHFIQSVSTISL